jgi:hypothetical protein
MMKLTPLSSLTRTLPDHHHRYHRHHQLQQRAPVLKWGVVVRSSGCMICVECFARKAYLHQLSHCFARITNREHGYRSPSNSYASNHRQQHDRDAIAIAIAITIAASNGTLPTVAK